MVQPFFKNPYICGHLLGDEFKLHFLLVLVLERTLLTVSSFTWRLGCYNADSITRTNKTCHFLFFFTLGKVQDTSPNLKAQEKKEE